MAIVRWSPFQELARVREAMDRLWEDSFPRLAPDLWGYAGELPLDIYETHNDLVVK
ncbi:MAG: Hsp20/alpha crystallin family protein, partial [Chloroflexi bacterium]|nr:Hsp20/alpha crystallin family protein [Chloroflexota bacterium]